MKVIAITTAYILLSISTIAQTQIDGVGILRLGKDRKTILNQFDSLDVEYGDLSTMSMSEQLKLHMYYSKASCLHERHFYVKNYRISTVNTQLIEIAFFKDTLYSIELKSNFLELADAIDYAYGKVERRYEKEPVECKYTYTGATFTKEGFTIMSTWRDDHSILCTGATSRYYDAECKEQFLQYIHIKLKPYMEKVKQCREDLLQDEKKLLEAEKADKYKDFR